MSTSVLSWNSIYERWKSICSDLYEPILTDAGFRILEFNNIPGIPQHHRNNGSYIGWWQIEDVEKNINDIPLNGIPNDTWRIAHINTAKMLWKHQDNPEAISLIWIGAFLVKYDKSRTCMDNLFKRLQYEDFHTLEQIVFERMFELELETWSSSTKYPVPDCLLESYYLGTIFAPTNTLELLDLIALETSFLRTRWQLVDIRLI